MKYTRSIETVQQNGRFTLFSSNSTLYILFSMVLTFLTRLLVKSSKAYIYSLKSRKWNDFISKIPHSTLKITKLTINYISDMHDLNHSLKTDIEDRESLYMFIVQWAR